MRVLGRHVMFFDHIIHVKLEMWVRVSFLHFVSYIFHYIVITIHQDWLCVVSYFSVLKSRFLIVFFIFFL